MHVNRCKNSVRQTSYLVSFFGHSFSFCDYILFYFVSKAFKLSSSLFLFSHRKKKIHRTEKTKVDLTKKKKNEL